MRSLSKLSHLYLHKLPPALQGDFNEGITGHVLNRRLRIINKTVQMHLLTNGETRYKFKNLKNWK
jgi:hypothetical protein